MKALARPGLAGLAAGLAASVAFAAAPPKGWQTLTAGTTQGVFPLGYASGRVWFAAEDVRGNDSIVSAHVGGSGLSSVVSTPMGQSPWLPSSFIVGSSLVSPQGKSSAAAPLLASGKLGSYAPLPGDPEGTAKEAFVPPNSLPAVWLAAGGVTVGGRPIWAVNGQSCPKGGLHQCTPNGGGYSSLVLCCTASGQASDLTDLLSNRTKAGATGLRMGVDAHRRIWVAWMDGGRPHTPLAPVTLKLAQIDPVTLKALSSKTLATAIFSSGGPLFDLACTDGCRTVYENASGVYSWGGDGPATRLWANDRRKDKGAHLLAAAGGGTSLRVAAYSDKVPTVPDDGQRLALARGDARGRNIRVAGSVDIPQNLPAGGTHFFYPIGVPVSIFTPSALVSFELYLNDASSRLLDSVLHG
jgi:hypothetical protein